MPKHSAVTNDILACCGAADTSICTGGQKQEKPEKGGGRVRAPSPHGKELKKKKKLGGGGGGGGTGKGFKADLRKQQVMRPRGNANAELAERAFDY